MTFGAKIIIFLHNKIFCELFLCYFSKKFHFEKNCALKTDVLSHKEKTQASKYFSSLPATRGTPRLYRKHP